MAWRRGEIWLDTDVLWFREPSGGLSAALALRAPTYFGLAAAPVAAVAMPNGLAASRQRRAELRRSRNAKRARTAALVISPALLLSVAAPRLAGGSRAGGVLHEDPPSQTFRLGPAGLEVAGEPLIGRVAAPAPRDAASEGGAAEPPAEIHWHRATSAGLPYSGSLSGGTQLPLEGPDWVTWNPVSDSVPNEPYRLYGNERTIRAIVSVVSAYRAATPGAPRAVVGDISFRNGGPMEQHRSHQNGLDVDVYYPRLDGVLRAPASTGQIDRRLAQDLLDRFVAAGAEKIFVGYSTGLHGPSDVVVPYPNHENHMHIRFRHPPG